MNVSVEEYIDKLVDMCNIKISCMAQVEETKQFYCDSDDFRLCKPDLLIKVWCQLISCLTNYKYSSLNKACYSSIPLICLHKSVAKCFALQAPPAVKVGEEYDVEVSFTNPLPRALTKCEFQIEGASLQRPVVQKHKSVSPPYSYLIYVCYLYISTCDYLINGCLVSSVSTNQGAQFSILIELIVSSDLNVFPLLAQYLRREKER